MKKIKTAREKMLRTCLQGGKQKQCGGQRNYRVWKRDDKPQNRLSNVYNKIRSQGNCVTDITVRTGH